MKAIHDHLRRIFGPHGYRNFSCHVEKGYDYSVKNAAGWMIDMRQAAVELNLPDAEYQIGLLYDQFIEEY